MEYRRQFKFDTEVELQTIRIALKRNDETIHRLTYEDQPFQVQDLVTRTREKNAALTLQEEDLVEKLEAIDNGEYDNELRAARESNTVVIKEKTQLTRKKKAGAAPPAAAQANLRPAPGGANWIVTDREMDYEYKRYLRSVAKFPEKLAEKLEKLPHNHGIIFNQIVFYGKRPPKKPLDTLVLQDKQGEKFYVHYWTPTEHLLYLKEGFGRNTREVLVSREPQPALRTGFSPRRTR